MSPPGNAKEDWKIIRAFSEYINKTLPYNNISQLRASFENINKNFIYENSLIKAETNDIGDTKIKLNNSKIHPLEINYFMTCPISRSSETMAKCSIAKSKLGMKC